jgi:transcription elongation GreA/GreB family factor
MISKETVYGKCLQIAHQKVELLQQHLAGLRDNASNETKSTAGDKHETALAMLQIEQANTGKQLEEAQELYRQLTKINIHWPADSVVTGSLVNTNNGYFFISVALGKIAIDEQIVFALSRNAPLGQRLFGLKVDGQVEVNGKKYVVEEIL